ncbi:MAG: CFI-box-CTERM domain-containing protein [Promethearchaeota archaeon]
MSGAKTQLTIKSIVIITIITMIISGIVFYFLFTNIFGYNPNLQYGVDPYVVVSANTMAFLMTIILIITIEGIIVANVAIYTTRKRKGQAKLEAKNYPNAYVCNNCNEYSRIYTKISFQTSSTAYCLKCGSLMVKTRLDFLPNVKIRGGPCWIATAVYGDPYQPQIETLRDFRDGFMDTSYFGSNITKFYYKTSPPLAKFIQNSYSLRIIFKTIFIKPFVRIAQFILRLKQKNYIQNIKEIRKILRRKYNERY